MSATLKILCAIDRLVCAAAGIQSKSDTADIDGIMRHVEAAIALAENALDALDGERRALLDAARAKAFEEYNRKRGGE